MGRSFKRKTPKRDPQILHRAVAAMALGSSLRETARNFDIPRSTLLLHRRNNEAIRGKEGNAPPTEVDIDTITIVEKGFKTVTIILRIGFYFFFFIIFYTTFCIMLGFLFFIIYYYLRASGVQQRAGKLVGRASLTFIRYIFRIKCN